MSKKKIVIGLLSFFILLCITSVLYYIFSEKKDLIKILPRNDVEKTILTDKNINVTLVAMEPDIINPMSLAFYSNNVFYVSESSTYRYGLEGSPVKDSSLLNPIKYVEIDESGKAKFTKVVASGFTDPVMGLAIFENKLFATNLNQLFVMDILPDGSLGNRRVLVRDSAIPWNPFGMYRIMIGPDNKLWLAVADHPESSPVRLVGTDSSRVEFNGQSGGFIRCDLDGSNLEKLADGVRAPFVFDFDPWGHFWAISNGEGSPNLYIEVIPGMDYGYHSRTVSYEWLAGKTELAPPVTEMGPGANTIALHYYSSMFPFDKYWGAVFIGNWGSHGAFPSNRTISVYYPIKEGEKIEDTNNILERSYIRHSGKEFFVTSSDSMFRPVGMYVGPDGSLFLLDWHGRDDESDPTGRIFKLTFVGSDKNRYKYIPDEIDKMDLNNLCKVLGDRNQFNRSKAKLRLTGMGDVAIPQLTEVLKTGTPLAAANAIWVLSQMNDSNSIAKLSIGLKNTDGRIRALALRQLRFAAGIKINNDLINLDYSQKRLISRERLSDISQDMINDPVDEVRLEAALNQFPLSRVSESLGLIIKGIKDSRLLYQIGFELGRLGDRKIVELLHESADPVEKKLSLIAAQTVLDKDAKNSLFELVRNWNIPADENIGARFFKRIESSNSSPSLIADKLMTLDWMHDHPSKSNSNIFSFLKNCLDREQDYLTIMGTLRTLRIPEYQNNELQKVVLDKNLNPGKESSPYTKPILTEAIYTLASFTDIGPLSYWKDRLKSEDKDMLINCLRALRQVSPNLRIASELWPIGLEVSKKYTDLSEEVFFTFSHLGISESELRLIPKFSGTENNSATLQKEVLSMLNSKFDGKPNISIARGKWTFDLNCNVCHSTKIGDDENKLGPNLSTIGSASQTQYIIESIVDPSKVLKTGFQLETIETKDGKTYSGQATVTGEKIVVRNFGQPDVTLNLDNIKKRTTSHRSLMPEGLYKRMTLNEFADLVSYLKTLRGN